MLPRSRRVQGAGSHSMQCRRLQTAHRRKRVRSKSSGNLTAHLFPPVLSSNRFHYLPSQNPHLPFIAQRIKTMYVSHLLPWASRSSQLPQKWFTSPKGLLHVLFSFSNLGEGREESSCTENLHTELCYSFLPLERKSGSRTEKRSMAPT